MFTLHSIIFTSTRRIINPWIVYMKFHKIEKLYEILGVDKDCEDEVLRLAFVNLVKKYHPDSASSEADALQFSKIETAYREIQKLRSERKECDIEILHTTPQHRHYLTYDKGTGTLSSRQKMYTAERAQQAAINVMEHRLQNLQGEERDALIEKDKKRARDIKSGYGMDRLVEDLIQEAMNKGEFQNLRGMGKPLPDKTNSFNPYVDFVTYKMNEILINNGFIPEWIQLLKEIRQDIQELKNSPNNVENRIKEINKKIDKYNLLVPILQNQMPHITSKDS